MNNSKEISTETAKRKRIYPERLSESDLDGAAELEKLCFSNPWSKNSLELLTKDGIGMGMVCRKDGGVVAYGGMLCIVDEGQITNIATHPDYRRQGYGRAIVEALKKYASENGINSISLEVRASNESAIAMYSSLGFRTEGRRKGFYTKPAEDALIMICKIR